MAVAVIVLATPQLAHAYIGPGAGIALASSFFAVLAAFFSALLLLFTWPVRILWRFLFGRRGLSKSRVKRVVVLGLDGLDHGLTQRLLSEGKLPNLAALRDEGCFRSLGSTLPPISPVAWSTFQTGVNPGKHNIFDFLTPDRRTYVPKMSSVEIRQPRRMLRVGKFQLPLGRADIHLLRKSRPFWSLLSQSGIFNCILRVPITFPPEKLRGVQLSAMCVPDLRGTQGMFSYYTTRAAEEDISTGGEVHRVKCLDGKIRCELLGPDNPLRSSRTTLKTPFEVIVAAADRAVLKIGGKKYDLRLGHYSDWIQVRYRIVPGMAVSGLCKFLLLATSPDFELYVTPVNIDPEKPAMPIGYPSVYSIYLAKQQGPFATLGLAEDTWALNEEVLDDAQFLKQCLDIDDERVSMFFDSLDKVRSGLCVCVFDATDRLQHMFWRYLDKTHPARPKEIEPKLATVIEDLYQRMDGIVGKARQQCDDDDTVLMVISDHGFNSFRRGIDLNRWLEENGYLTVDDARRGEEYLAGIDWSKTRAFAVGLTGIFINIKDKYEQGIVAPGEEADQLREELARKISELVDPADGSKPIRRVYNAHKVYRGPYKDQAPDLILGYERGYRVSWEAAIGKTTRELFHDNTKAWSGDHCVDPSVVPGVLFCNRRIESENPRLIDIAPTILDLFGVKVPDYMDGRVLGIADPVNEQAAPSPFDEHDEQITTHAIQSA
jgi:predicted AlkP superfamily phosphohydrolase/phosphomutase